MSFESTPSLATSAKLKLDIVGGLHSGVTLPLKDGDYSIGSASEADIVLRDDGIAPQHIIICVAGNDIRVEALGGDVVVGEEELEAGHGYRLRLPTTLTLGNASLQLSRNGAQAGGLIDRLPLVSSLMDRPGLTAFGVLGCVLAVTAAVYGMRQIAPEEPGSHLALANDAASASVPALQKPSASVTEAERLAAVEALKEKLSASGLSGVAVKAQGAEIAVAGLVPENKAGEWTSIQRWFDQTYAPKLMLTASIAIGQAAAPPVIYLQAIWYGERPYIIAENGIRYYEGAILDNGWILQQIGEGGVTLKRNEEKLTLTFR